MENNNLVKCTLIHDLRSISSGIYNTYRSSRLPKKIKKMIALKRVKKLKETIYAIENDFMPSALLIEYFTIIGLEYPPNGTFRNTILIKSKDLNEEFIALFKFEFIQSDETYIVKTYFIYNNSDKTFTVEYQIINKSTGKSIMSFNDNIYDSALAASHRYTTTEIFDIQKESYIVRDLLIEKISDDIKTLLLEDISFYLKRGEIV